MKSTTNATPLDSVTSSVQAFYGILHHREKFVGDCSAGLPNAFHVSQRLPECTPTDLSAELLASIEHFHSEGFALEVTMVKGRACRSSDDGMNEETNIVRRVGLSSGFEFRVSGFEFRVAPLDPVTSSAPVIYEMHDYREKFIDDCSAGIANELSPLDSVTSSVHCSAGLPNAAGVANAFHVSQRYESVPRPISVSNFSQLSSIL